MRITIGGLLGSGTTTLSKNLKGVLEYPYIYAGQIFRDRAESMGISLEKLNTLAETDKNFDLETDRQMMNFADKNENAIVEGRLAGWFAHREKLENYYKIWLTAPFDTRLERVAGRENESMDLAREKMHMREKSEAKRYRDIYGIDITDISIYDLIVDNKDMEPEETLNTVLKALKKKGIKFELN